MGCGGSKSNSQPTNPVTADFAVAVTPASLTLTPNVPQTLTIAVTPSGGFSGNVTVAFTSSSSHLALSAGSISVAAGSNGKVTVIADTTLVNSSGTISLTATSGSLSHAAQVAATVGKFLTPTFATRVDISTGGTTPSYLAVADFNGDGFNDIAVANTGSHNITVFLSNGDGTFKAPVMTTVNLPPPATLGPIVAMDFNEDQKQDLVISTAASPLYAIPLLGNGDGTFTQQNSIVSVPGFLQGIGADVNNDNHVDLVLAQPGQIQLLPGAVNADLPTIQTLTPPSSSTFALYYAAVTGDFNNDSQMDVVGLDYGMTNSNIDEWNDPEGDMSATKESTLPSAGAASIAAADFNGDNKLDLLIGFPYSAVIAYGNGDGTFQASTPKNIYSGNSSGQQTEVATADMNLDGLPDAIVANWSDQTVTLVVNDGAGFANPTGTTFQTLAHPVDVKIADFNGDGIPDIVVANDAAGSISLFLSQSPTGSRTSRRRMH